MTVMVRNQVGTLTKTFRLPADVEDAQAFCESALEGVYRIYKKEGEQGDPRVDQAILVRVMVRNNQTGQHWFLTFYAKPNKDKQDIISALSQWPNADDIIILDFRRVQFATSTNSGSGSGSGNSSGGG